MEAKRGVMSSVFVIVLITMAACSGGRSSGYEAQIRREWNKFLQYLKEHKPPLTLEHCSGAHVIEYLKFLDNSGVTKVHVSGCPCYGNRKLYAPCACSLKQAWISLNRVNFMLKVAYRESRGPSESNPFDAPAVKIYLRQVKECQEKARGVTTYRKKKSKCATVGEAGTSSGGARSEPAVRPPLINMLFQVSV